MVSGVDTSPVQSTLVEATTAANALNQARQGNSNQLIVGKQVQAEVLTSLEDGSYIVKVGDTAARMQLPNSPQVGSKLTLTLLSNSPRATFLLGAPGEEANATTSATLGNANQLIDDFTASGAKTSATAGLYLSSGSTVGAVDELPADPRLLTQSPTTPDSTPTSFSTTGKLINQLMQNSSQADNVNVSKVPLMTAPGAAVADLAKALQTGVSTSGVFYEAHLLQWAEGNLPTTELMKEPQASFNNTPAANVATNEATNATTNNTTTAATTAIVNSNTVAATAVELPKEALPIIQQQLQTLEQQRFVWHGELWSGQPLEWEVSQDQSRQQANPAENIWRSSVRFQLAQLGDISAQLQLTGTHLSITVTTKNAATALLLKNSTSELAGALNGTGAQLDSLLVKTEP